MRRKSKTASELLKELEADPEYLERIAKRDAAVAEQARACARDEAALVAELRSLGHAVESVYDLVNTASPYPALYPVLVRHLDEPHRERIREGIIRALTVKDAATTAQDALFRHFQHESNRYLKWVLANALKTVMPYRERRKHPEIAEVYRADPFA
jgi:hypothetical protein